MALNPQVIAYLASKLQESQEGDKMVRVVQDVLAFLRQHHLLTQMRLPPQYVGVHPSNRDGYGLNALDVHDLIDSVVDVGFVPSKVQAIGVEVEDDEVRRWNERLVASVDGLLGVMDGNALKITSLCGSHTNFALRCVAQSVAHENPHISVGGRLSLQLLQERDPAYYAAVVEGLQWDVLAAPVAKAFPQLLCLISRSGNASLARGEHELQVLRRIHGAYTRLAQTGSKPSFAAIKKQVLASKPACAGSVPYMYTFVLKASGGSDATLLSETEAYVRANCPTTRQLGAELWEALGGECKGHSAEPVARFRHALMKLAYLRQCVSVSDAKKMFGKDMFSKVKAADTMMTAVRKLLREHCGADVCMNNAMTQALGFQDMAMAAHVLGIKLKGEKRWQKIEGIAHDFVVLARGILGAPDLPDPWAADAEDSQADVSAEAASGSMPLLELGDDGTLKDPSQLLASRGLVVGCHLRRKADKTEGKMASHKNGMIYVELEGGAQAKVELNSMLQGEWVLFTPKAEVELLDIQPYMPSSNVDYQAGIKMCQIQLELADMESLYEESAQMVQLQLKPNKLIAKCTIPKGKLTLVPTTSKVTHKPGYEVLTDWKLDSRKFYVVSACVLPSDGARAKPFVVPFFYVQFTEDIEQANLELQHLKVKNGKFKFPVYRNHVKIEEGDLLLCYKRKEAKYPPLDISPSTIKRKRDASPSKKKTAKK